MKTLHITLAILVLVAVLASFAGPSQAEVEWSEISDFDLGTKPLDVVASKDGQVIFILTKGEILQFDPKSKTISGRIPIGPKFNQIALSDESNMLVVTSASGKTIKLISYEMIYNIDISSLPAIGPENAPVVITIFSDYQ